MEQTNLDSLMMACADFSGQGKMSCSFRGPPLKDVPKPAKSDSSQFQASAKARDWTCLELALEDAFVQHMPSQGHHVANQLGLTDDWGDFQECADPQPLVQAEDLHAVAPSTLPSLPSVAKVVAPPPIPGPEEVEDVDDDDDDGDEDDKEDDFADFVEAMPPACAGQKSQDLMSDYVVGSRLATFQEESPVHQFRPMAAPKSEPLDLLLPLDLQPVEKSEEAPAYQKYSDLCDMFNVQTANVASAQPAPDVVVQVVTAAADEDFGEFMAVSEMDLSVGRPSSGCAGNLLDEPLPEAHLKAPMQRETAGEDGQNADPPSEDVQKKWLTCLSHIAEVLSQASDTFSNITDLSVLDEVLQSQEGANYLINLIEVFRVSKRIQTAHSRLRMRSAEVEEKSQQVNTLWRHFAANLKSRSSFLPSEQVFDFSECTAKSQACEDEPHCGLCQLGVVGCSVEASQVKETVIMLQDAAYHNTCINFWLNCVQEAVPPRPVLSS